MAREQEIPFVFALGRKALGRCVNKLVPVSVVGIFNYSGAEVRHTHPLKIVLIVIQCDRMKGETDRPSQLFWHLLTCLNLSSSSRVSSTDWCL